MRLDFAILAEAVSPGQGKLFIHGAPLKMVEARQLPWAISLGVAISFTLDASDLGEKHSLELWLTRPESDRDELVGGPLPLEFAIDVPADGEIGAIVSMQLGLLGLTDAGVHTLRLLLDKEPLKVLTFRVGVGPGVAPDLPSPES